MAGPNALIHSLFKIIFLGEYYCHSHFIDEETEAQRDQSDMLEITQLVGGVWDFNIGGVLPEAELICNWEFSQVIYIWVIEVFHQDCQRTTFQMTRKKMMYLQFLCSHLPWQSKI
jgi:hypothetical protein